MRIEKTGNPTAPDERKKWNHPGCITVYKKDITEHVNVYARSGGWDCLGAWVR
jgi:hypothetical protein